MCKQRNKPYGIIVRKMDYPSSASVDEVRRIMTGIWRGERELPQRVSDTTVLSQGAIR